MSTMATTLIEEELAAIVGVTHVGQETRDINGVVPSVAVSPGSAKEIAAVLQFANSRDLVVAPAGGFTKQQIGGIPERVDILLRLNRLNQVEHYDPGDLTVSLGAGITFAEVQSKLAEHQQWLPYDAPNLERTTVGGSLATASPGPMKSSVGGLREFCIGVQFVTADGKIAKGGARVVKNVAGYDLMKLMIGSYGSLAIITQANFKVFPKPRQTATFLCSFATLEDALAFRNRVLQSPLAPMCLEIISPRAPEYLCDSPPAHSPDDYAPAHSVAPPATEWQIALRAGGSDNVLGRYRRELGDAVTKELDGETETQFWSWMSHFERSVLARHRNALMIYTHLTIQNVGAAIQALERCAPDHNFIPAAIGRAATGNLLLAFVPLSVDPPAAMQYANCVSAFRALLPPGSAAVVTQCPKEAKAYFDVWGSSSTDVEMMRTVRRALDPNNILNRGRFIV
jgi:glycolate dehydrogenase FAD-binding subunit